MLPSGPCKGAQDGMQELLRLFWDTGCHMLDTGNTRTHSHVAVCNGIISVLTYNMCKTITGPTES